MAQKIKTELLYSRKEIKASKITDHFKKHKEWHDKWSKVAMSIFGVSLWVLVLGGIFGVGYFIRLAFHLLVSQLTNYPG